MIAPGQARHGALKPAGAVEPAELRRLVEEGRTCRKEEPRPATGSKGQDLALDARVRP